MIDASEADLPRLHRQFPHSIWCRLHGPGCPLAVFRRKRFHDGPAVSKHDRARRVDGGKIYLRGIRANLTAG